MISDSVIEETSRLAIEFASAKPFRHVCIEGFLEEDIARGLLEEFPSFDPEHAVNEFGQVGRKAVKTDLRSIGPRYQALHDYLGSSDFLGYMSKLLGIPDLRFDSGMYGGGTHENLEGQELDPHIDFNYDQSKALHRRVNLLIYLNEEWSPSWGGAIQLHSDPWDWENDEVQTFNCEFNRCVIFETNEHSWHGFHEIRLPESKRGLSRKCISIYLYSAERPADEIVPAHGTFYAQRPLPPHLTEGHVLSGKDLDELRRLLKKRDDWIRRYQAQELQLSGQVEESARYIGELLANTRMPVKGYVSQRRGSAEGVYSDAWLAPRANATFVAEVPVTSISVAGWLPESAVRQVVDVEVGGTPIGILEVIPGESTCADIPVSLPRGSEFNVTFSCQRRMPNSTEDSRELGFVLSDVTFWHGDLARNSRSS